MEFGPLLRQQLQSNGFNVTSIQDIIIPDRVRFNSFFDKFNGKTILIDDTHKTIVNLDCYYINSNGDFVGTFTITITDHFGLDNGDIHKHLIAPFYIDLGEFQNLAYVGKGFAAWWMLQHVYGYIPFITTIVVHKQITVKK